MYKEERESVLGNYKQVEMARTKDCYPYLVDSHDIDSLEWGCKFTTIKETVEDFSSELKRQCIEIALSIDKDFILSIPLDKQSSTYIVFKNGVQVYSCTDEVSIDYVIRKKFMNEL